MLYTLETFKNFTPIRDTYAVFGNPIAHSLSPQLHNAFADELNASFDYIAIEVTADEFPEALKIAKSKLCGFNLTMPFKQMVLPYLDFCDDEVIRAGSANTVKVNNGTFEGYTTDGIGLCSALLMSIDSLEKEVLIIGAGGSARSIASELSKAGAHITIAVRNIEKGNAFISELKEKTGNESFKCISINDIPDSYDILINTTPVGMNTAGISPISLDGLSKLQLVYDCIYSPPMTQLLFDAKSRKIPYDNGLSMLVLQGAFSEKHWFGATFDKNIIKEIILKLQIKQTLIRLKNVHNRENIALIGFMGSGKTTIGTSLSKLLGMDFIDLDDKIEKDAKMSISEIFKTYGEDHFRTLETKACEECASLKNTIISPGGGAVLFNNNDEILKRNAYLIFLNRSFDEIERNLTGSTNRPLLDLNDTFDLYSKRQPKYLAVADVSVSFPSNDIDESTRHILLHI